MIKELKIDIHSSLYPFVPTEKPVIYLHFLVQLCMGLRVVQVKVVLKGIIVGIL
jgi:hypothetical protein